MEGDSAGEKGILLVYLRENATRHSGKNFLFFGKSRG
jgi:hypothetical protein